MKKIDNNASPMKPMELLSVAIVFSIINFPCEVEEGKCKQYSADSKQYFVQQFGRSKNTDGSD
ncbi:MAG: hypothetical protein WCJ62_04885 [Flavobacterium sp.]